jgi:ATP-binding cassette subfamily G (WHITE) protein 2 (PDR)
LRGRTIYTAEADIHHPQLTVGEVLSFVAQARATMNPLAGISMDLYAEHMRDIVMAMLGMRHTINTKVGNETIPGIHEGERKRLSIAEAALSNCPIQCWDNTTLELDNIDVLEFFKTLKLTTDYLGTTACISMRQVPQDVYDVCSVYHSTNSHK